MKSISRDIGYEQQQAEKHVKQEKLKTELHAC